MEAALVENVVVVRYFIELNRLYLLELRLVNRPRCLLVLEQPVGVVVGEFGEAGTRDIDEFHLGLAGRVMARRSFGDIGGAGTGGLRHLVVLASARVVLQVEEPPAEILRRELNDVRKDPGVEPVIGQRADFHKAIMFLEVNDVVVVVSFRSFFRDLVVVAFIFFVISRSRDHVTTTDFKNLAKLQLFSESCKKKRKNRS